MTSIFAERIALARHVAGCACFGRDVALRSRVVAASGTSMLSNNSSNRR